MNKTQLPFLVEGILILATMTVGYLLGRKEKPYGKVKLGIHIFFFLWLTMGFYFIARALAMTEGAGIIWIPIGIMGLTLLIQLVTGILMLASKKVGNALLTTHITSAVLMLVSDIAAFFITGNH